jgi:hypothetical protein
MPQFESDLTLIVSEVMHCFLQNKKEEEEMRDKER